MVLKAHRWTRADLGQLPEDGNRYEVLDGQLLVTPQASPPHQWIASRLIRLLDPYVARHEPGIVVGPAAVVLGENELQPDVAVLPVSPEALPETWDRVPSPLLVVEILSRSTRMRDLGIKRRAYQREGIPAYWVIDRSARRALVWTPGQEEATLVTDVIEWQPRQGIGPHRLRMEEILLPSNA